MNERSRKSVVIDPRHLKIIFAALERWAESGEFIALRTRGFAYVIADGAVRTKSAVWLNIEEVAKESSAGRILVAQSVQARANEGNGYKAREFVLSERARAAIADYLKVARSDGWLKDAARLEGPLWISTHHKGTQERMSQRTANQAWQAFLREQLNTDLPIEYQFDDLAFTGRVQFSVAAHYDSQLVSEHAGISERWARERLTAPRSSSPREVMAKLNQQQKRQLKGK